MSGNPRGVKAELKSIYNLRKCLDKDEGGKARNISFKIDPAEKEGDLVWGPELLGGRRRRGRCGGSLIMAKWRIHFFGDLIAIWCLGIESLCE